VSEEIEESDRARSSKEIVERRIEESLMGSGFKTEGEKGGWLSRPFPYMRTLVVAPFGNVVEEEEQEDIAERDEEN
jgi:hypothetical protein